MILTKEKVVTRSGNLSGDTIKMQIDANSLEHLSFLLSDLYSDAWLAIIREYSTNGYDSHIAAGKPGVPIDVKLPTAFRPTFVVKDYGVGLSLDDVQNIYALYGASTKRETNDQVGALGLGCKSALAAVNSFTITSVKNGRKVLAQVSKSETGAGQIEIVSHEVTSESNGVEISIPVTNSTAFNSKAHEFFKFWKPGTVLVDGEEPNRGNQIHLGDNIYIVDGINSDYVVMGGVPYVVEEQVEGTYGKTGIDSLTSPGSWGRKSGIVAYIEIGDVTFTPSREALSYTRKTADKLANIRLKFNANIEEYIALAIDSCATKSEVLAKAKEFEISGLISNYVAAGSNSLRGWNNIVWNGIGLPKTISFDHWSLEQQYNGRVRAYDMNRFEFYRDSNSPEKVMIVTEYYVAGRPTSSIRAKAWKYVEDSGSEYESIIFVKSGSGQDFDPDKWLDSYHQVSYETIKALKLPKNVTSGGSSGARKQTAGSWEVWGGVSYNEVTDLDRTNKIVYFHPADVRGSEYERQPENFRSAIGSDATLVKVGANRLKNFLKEYPEAVSIMSFLKDAISSVKFTEEDFILDSGYESSEYSLIAENIDRIDDPEIKKYSMAIKNGHSIEFNRFKYVIQAANLLNRTGNHEHISVVLPTSKKKYSDPMGERYPLVPGYFYSAKNRKKIKEHVVIYMNTIYSGILAAQLEESNKEI